MKSKLIKMKLLGLFLCSGWLFLACTNTSNPSTDIDVVKYVDQYIGTGGHGHVFMGANVPFGAVQLGPTSIPQEWDWTSGYHISDTTVIGFSHLHLSGTGIGDLSDIVLMPTTGAVNHNRGVEGNYETGMWSYFSRANEKCLPGYYATKLDRYNIDVELTATKRVGLHKYDFPAGTIDSRVVIDLENGTCWDKPIESHLQIVNNTTVVGYRYSKGWADSQRVYFVAEFSKPFNSFNIYDKNDLLSVDNFTATNVYGEACYENIGDEPLLVKVAISPISIENAKLNLKEELPHWDFQLVKQAAYAAWNTELSKIKIKSADNSVMRNFYTALYHSMIAPSVFNDVNGDYRGSDGNNRTGNNFINYTTFSLWDTYRAAHPLMTIIHPEKIADIINTMLHIYQQQGKLPVWHLMGCETDCMVGNPGIPVVADAMLKDFKGFDYELAYEAMKQSAMLDERGMDLYKEYGYIPFDKHNESVAISLEYALADWALACVAKKMGKEEDYEYFNNRSKAYKYYFDVETKFLRGLSSKKEWRKPFDPFHSTHREDDYTEGNAWQYTWLVPHDVEGLVELFGSREKFHNKLDSLFVVEGDLGNEASPDISGLIGQYAHGNEPSHHIIYFYTMTGQPWKSANLVRQVLTELYHDQPDGISGNEDVGQMSAWYILSALGFYQVEPAGGRYYFGSPLVDEAIINVGEGKALTIRVNNNSPQNIYIQHIRLNGKNYTLPYIDFVNLASGGELELEMGSKPTSWY